MADRNIQLFASSIPEIDWRAAEQCLSPRPGCTVVEQWPVPDARKSGLIIGGGRGDKWRLSPDIGTVLACHPGVELMPGDVVLFDHEHGKRMSGFHVGDYRPYARDLGQGDFEESDVRFFGRVVIPEMHGVKRVPWQRSIFARITNLEAGLENIGIAPVGDQVIIKRDPLYDAIEVEGTSFTIHLPENQQWRNSIGIVHSVGDWVDDIEPGMRVVYTCNVTRPAHPLLAPEFKDKDLVFIQADAILAELVGDGKVATR